MAQEMNRRERLYGDFIDEASRLLADALTHHLEESSKNGPHLRDHGKAEALCPRERRRPGGRGDGQIVEIYDLPNADFRNAADRPAQQRVDILRAFGEACRDDLQRYPWCGCAA